MKFYASSLVVCLALALTLLAQPVGNAHAALLPVRADEPTPHSVYLPAISQYQPPTPTQSPTPTQVPTQTPTLTPQPTDTPAPSGVRLLSDRAYWSGTSYHVLAEVINNEGEQVCGVEAVGTFYDAGGALVATENAYAMLSALDSQQQSPLHLLVFNAPTTISRYALNLTWDTRCYLNYRAITVVSQNVRDNFGAEVFGEVRNDHAETLKSVNVVVTFRSADGRIQYAAEGYLSGSTELAPGQTGVYSVRTYEDDLLALPYTVQAQGYFLDNR